MVAIVYHIYIYMYLCIREPLDVRMFGQQSLQWSISWNPRKGKPIVGPAPEWTTAEYAVQTVGIS